MPCAHPIRGYRATGGRVVFAAKEAISLDMIKVGCGRCSYCRLERARNWAVRCMCEASLHDSNSFVTLTYSVEGLVDDSLHVEHLQLFFKRLRKKFSFRYFACGEYGDLKGRPHYHVLFFGLSESVVTLEPFWKHGLVHVGSLTFESCAYVARYCLKKFDGKLSDFYLDEDTGELMKPPYVVMSRRPGVGRPWLDKYFSDVFPSDELVSQGFVVKPPKYFMEVLKVVDPVMAKVVQTSRLSHAIDEDERYRREGLSEQIIESRLSALSRHVEV
nr:MAG: replication initiator protein [Microviridae sp.]